MSNVDTTKTKKSEQLTNWKEMPFEVKIMDFASFAWLAIGIINIVLSFFISLNVRTFPAFFLPFFLFILTISLRLRLVDKPENKRNTLITWFVIFVLITLTCIAIVIFYPPID